MKTKHLMLFVWFAALLAAAETPRQVYQNALYLECGTGDLAAGLSGYEQVIGAAGEAGLVQAARWRSALCLEQLGRPAAAAARLIEILSAPAESAADGSADLREAAARALLRLADEQARAGAGPAAQAAEWTAHVNAVFPALAERVNLEQAIQRRTLRGQVDTWDGHRPVNAGVRIRLRAAGQNPAEERSTWRTRTDGEGHFAIELPVGHYEVRACAPAYDRVYGSATLTPEEPDAPDLCFVLPRIRLPAAVQRVDVVGSFTDDWEGALPLTNTAGGVWEARVRLDPGRHEYKFCINADPHLITDAAAAAFAADSHDDYNALLELDREQEVVFRFDENDPHYERPAGIRRPAAPE